MNPPRTGSAVSRRRDCPSACLPSSMSLSLALDCSVPLPVTGWRGQAPPPSCLNAQDWPLGRPGATAGLSPPALLSRIPEQLPGLVTQRRVRSGC